jgi:RHS repeat-associated protein
MAGETRVISGVSKSMSYTYNVDGSLKTAAYPSGAVITYTPDSAGRDVSAFDNGNGINYVTGASYGPASNLTGFISGQSSGFRGVTNNFTYNKRLQPINMSAVSPAATVFSLNYDFHLGAGDNGNVFGITNNKDTSRNQSFTYDTLNRLTSAQNAGTNCSATTVNGKTEYWGNNYAYDAWGNLLQKSVTKCSAENLSLTALANNQLSGYSYDAAGNMTHDATSGLNYSYDQENRSTGAAGYAYTYDGDGNRVKKSNGSTGTLYWYMSPGIVAESDLSGNLTSEYAFFDSERVARKDFPGGAVSYYFSDHLKTTDIVTDAQGNIKNESDFYPWGGELQFSNNDSNHYKFTGKERDAESGLDYFGARYYSNGLGRFITADWSSAPMPVPYADVIDPQSLNLYAYVRNIPTTRLDPDGHEVIQEDDGLKGLEIPSGSKCPAFSTCRSDRVPPMSGSFVNRRYVIGAGKEVFTELLHVDPGQLTFDVLDDLMGVPDQFAAANDDERKAMKVTAILLLFVGGEDELPAKAESKLSVVVHHIATNKNFVGGFTAAFERIFAKAGMTLEHDANKMAISSLFHNGPHPDVYHQMVLRRLLAATDGKSGNAAEQALTRALNALRKYIEQHPEILRK